MNDIQVWFLRHGKPLSFDYENSKYDDFIQMLCNGHKEPLADDPGIDFKSLPKRVDFVGYSPFTRAIETAEILCNKLGVERIEELELLQEVGFDQDIISRHEYESLEGLVGNRKNILKRWYDGKNKAETFEDSLERVREIEAFLSERQEKTFILVTHGWFLRLLDVYFKQGKQTDITLDDILRTNPVPLGHCIKAAVARKRHVELPEPV
jgi:broad specificity phosphatase PhoE